MRDAHRRPAPDPWNVGFGVVALAAALGALLLWFPNDIRGGFVETDLAGKPQPGDAFFPVLLAVALALLSVAQVARALLARAPSAPAARLDARDLGFLFWFYAVVATGLALMYWLGPLAIGALRALGVFGADVGYRQLSDTVPYKYVGYVAGGLLMTLGLIARAEGRLRMLAVVAVVVVLAASVVLFDVLLGNVQLPPNADY